MNYTATQRADIKRNFALRPELHDILENRPELRKAVRAKILRRVLGRDDLDSFDKRVACYILCDLNLITNSYRSTAGNVVFRSASTAEALKYVMRHTCLRQYRDGMFTVYHVDQTYLNEAVMDAENS